MTARTMMARGEAGRDETGRAATLRHGFALVVTLAMILSLAVLALGMLGVGGREALLARQLETAVELRVAAESAARAHAAVWSTREAGTLAIGEARVVTPPAPAGTGEGGEAPAPAPTVELAVERLGRTLFLIRAEASRPEREGGRAAGRSVGRASMLIRVLDPAAIEGRFSAAVAVGSAVIEGGLVSGIDGCRDPGLTSGAPGIRATGDVVVDAAATIRGDPPVQEGAGAEPAAPDSGADSPDPLAPPLAPRLADRLVGPGVIAPAPVVLDGACAPDPGSWGSTNPSSACYPRLPMVFARGPLVVEGGEARAILVVDGDLTLDGPLRFEGIILVSGRLAVMGGASVRGAVAADGLLVGDGALLYDACAVRAAASAPALDRAFRPPQGWWIPAF